MQLSIFGSYLISGDRYTTPVTKMLRKELVVNVTTTHTINRSYSVAWPDYKAQHGGTKL